MIPSHFRKAAQWVKINAPAKYRQARWRKRSLPHFIIIGAQKSGTTSLFHYLAQHPQLIPSSVKEVHFFDGGLDPKIDDFSKGQAWYRTHFPLTNQIVLPQKTFEASPLYIFNPLVPKRIADLIPAVKLIALLRNPTERAISHYFFELERGHESLPLMEALQAEEDRLQPLIEKSQYKNNIFRQQSYKKRGLYHEQLERYLYHFPRDNILIMNAERLATEPETTLQRVFEFVGVDSEFKVEDLEWRNVVDNHSAVSQEVYGYLNDYFAGPNQALYDLIGEDYGW